jgi:hypothetical protein
MSDESNRLSHADLILHKRLSLSLMMASHLQVSAASSSGKLAKLVKLASRRRGKESEQKENYEWRRDGG